jgi:hypothetical protein
MVFTTEDKILIKNLVLLKDYSSRRLIKEFPNKGWKKMASISCCVRFEQRTVWIVSQVAGDRVRCAQQRKLMQCKISY